MTPTENPPADQCLAGRLAALRGEVGLAARRVGRDPAGVTVVVVTKSAPVSIFSHLHAAGVTDVGESRVQAAETRRAMCDAGPRWHLIGHLQSNKAQRAVALFDVLHGVDSVELLQRLDAAAAAAGRVPELLLQVNVSGEASKHGFLPRELPEALQASRRLRHLHVTGLMTMAPAAARSEDSRVHFQSLAALRDRCALPEEGLPLDQLSMGMSDDFTVAIEEGATLIRVGRRLVDGLPLPAVACSAPGTLHEHP